MQSYKTALKKPRGRGKIMDRLSAYGEEIQYICIVKNSYLWQQAMARMA